MCKRSISSFYLFRLNGFSPLRKARAKRLLKLRDSDCKYNWIEKRVRIILKGSPCHETSMVLVIKGSQHSKLSQYRNDLFKENFFLSIVVVIVSWSPFRYRQHILIEHLMNSASFRCHVFSSNYEQLLTYFLLTHSEPHTLTLSSGSFFLKTPH